MLRLQSLIPKALSKAHITRQVSAVQIVTSVSEILDCVITSELRSRICVKSFKDQVVYIDCNAEALRHEVQRHTSDILEALKDVYPDVQIKKLFVRVVTL